MAKSKSNKVEASSKEKPAFISYVNFNLLETHKSLIRQERVTDARVLQAYEELIGHGYRVTITPDLSSDAINCSCMGWSAENPNRGYVMNFRHVDFRILILTHAFVNGVVYQWGEWDTLNGVDPNLSW